MRGGAMTTQKGIVTNGTIKPYFSVKHLEGLEVEVNVKIWRSGRSSAQNRYIHGVVYPAVIQIISETHGTTITRGMAHDFCKRSFLGVERIAGIEIARSSRVLNVQEFTEYIERIRSWAWHFGNVVIPLPDYRE
jgi:hypothetical protein